MQNLIQGMTQEQAYAKAGYKPSSPNACILANKPHVKERLKEIRGSRMERRESRLLVLKMRANKAAEDDFEGMECTIPHLVHMAHEIFDIAVAEVKTGDAIAALKFMAEITGQMPEKRGRKAIGSTAVTKVKTAGADAHDAAAVDAALDKLDAPKTDTRVVDTHVDVEEADYEDITDEDADA